MYFPAFRASFQRLASHPAKVLSASFAILLSTFAVVDFNREISESELVGFQKRQSNHLGESLERLHFSAFCESMTFDHITFNRWRCEELYFLYKRAKAKKAELKKDVEFQNKSDGDIENIVASDFYCFGQRMCRRAMIRKLSLDKMVQSYHAR